MLLVCTPTAMDKQGVRNEIEIGAQLSSTLKDRESIIPLRLQRYEAPFRIVQAQYVDFSQSWATGLTELADLLGNVHRIPRSTGKPMADWLAAQTEGATRLIQQDEPLISNWLLIKGLPEFIYYCKPSAAISIDYSQDRTRHFWPAIPFEEGVLTFATPDTGGLLYPGLPCGTVAKALLDDFLENGWPDLEIDAYQARLKFSDLSNQAFDNFLRARGLTSYEGSGRRLAWWGNIRTVPLTQIRFGLSCRTGRRQIIGVSAKRNVHWHYGINVQIRTAPVRHARLSARLIFTENGLDAINDPKRMHRLWRSFAKSWRNARWRDMMLAFLWWVANGKSEISLQVANLEQMTFALPPASFNCPVSVVHGGELPLDEDDPDVELDEWDFSSDERMEIEDQLYV